MQERKKQSVLYDFLMEKKYRWTRHFLLIISIGIISTNHTFITYGEQIRGGNVCGIIFAHIVAYLLLIYLNMYIFIPKLLQQERYVQYAAVLLAAIFTFVIANIGLEYYIHFKYQIPFGPYSFFSDGRNKAVDFFSDFSVLTLSVTSITVIVFYKHWIQMTEMEEQIGTRRLTVELENLRNNIGSEFLLAKLKKATALCLTEPPEVSPLLLTLSRIVRYRLYDCSNPVVPLNSEIKILKDYLNLEKKCGTLADFTLSCQMRTGICFIPPLTLLSFVEEHLFNSPGKDRMEIEIEICADTLVCTCTNNSNPPKTGKCIFTISRRPENASHKTSLKSS